jgi:hypothetical protein
MAISSLVGKLYDVRSGKRTILEFSRNVDLGRLSIQLPLSRLTENPSFTIIVLRLEPAQPLA